MNKSILSISLDSNIVNPEYGDAIERQKEYAKYFDNYTIIVLNSQKNKLQKEKHFNNLHIYSLNSKTKYLYIFDAIYLIKKLNRKYHFDLVSSQDPLITGIIGYLTKLVLKITFNLQLHSTFCFDKNRKFNPILSLLIKFLINNANSIRTVFPNLNIKKQKNIKHIPLMVDLEFYYQKIKEKKEISKFIFIGRLAKEKNLELLIKAFLKINKKYPETLLTIVGDGPEKNTIKKLINSRNLQKNIKLTGFLSKQKIKNELQKNDCLILTSLYEGWPAVILEAGVAGIPITSSKVGAIDKIIKDKISGLLFQSNNLVELTKQMNYLMQNPNKACEFAQSNQKYVMDNFNKDRLLKDWINLLKNTK